MIQKIVLEEKTKTINIDQLDFSNRHGIINKINNKIRCLVVSLPTKNCFAILYMDNMTICGDGDDSTIFFKTEKEAVLYLFNNYVLDGNEIIAQMDKNIVVEN